MLIVQKVQYKRTQMFNESGHRFPLSDWTEKQR